MENETVSLWSKKQDEMTVGDSVKLAVGVTVLTTAAAFAVMAVAGASVRLAEKLAQRRADRSNKKFQEELIEKRES